MGKDVDVVKLTVKQAEEKEATLEDFGLHELKSGKENVHRYLHAPLWREPEFFVASSGHFNFYTPKA
ncbi:hypothetical protein [Humidesulfovibrio idahonensis]